MCYVQLTVFVSDLSSSSTATETTEVFVVDQQRRKVKKFERSMCLIVVMDRSDPTSHIIALWNDRATSPVRGEVEDKAAVSWKTLSQVVLCLSISGFQREKYKLIPTGLGPGIGQANSTHRTELQPTKPTWFVALPACTLSPCSPRVCKC